MREERGDVDNFLIKKSARNVDESWKKPHN